MRPHVIEPLFSEFVLTLPHPFSTVAPTSQLFSILTTFLSCSHFFSFLPTSAHLFSHLPNSSQLFSTNLTAAHLFSALLNSSRLFSPLATSSQLLPRLLTSAQLISPLLSSSHDLASCKLFSSLLTSITPNWCFRDPSQGYTVHTHIYIYTYIR